MQRLHPTQIHRHVTSFGGPGVTYTVALDDPCTAGSRIVVRAAGGAQTEIRFTDGAGALFDRRAQGLSAMDVSVHDAVAAGGEAQLHITLNGDENVVLEVSHTDLGAFVGGSAGTPSAVGGTDFHGSPASAVSVTGDAVIMAVWGVVTASPVDGTNSFRSMGPLGVLDQNDMMRDPADLDVAPASGTKFIYAMGTADVDDAGRWPVSAAAGDYQATSIWLGGGDTIHVAQAAYVDSSGVPTNATPPTAIAAENSLPGTFSANWFLGATGTNATICGYTDRRSYDPGDTVEFKVDSSGSPFRVEVYRLGYYSWETFGARLATAHITGTIETQSAPTVDPALGSTSCAWTTNATWTIPADACSGLYYVLFRRTDDTGQVSSHHLVVRPAAGVAGTAVVVIPDVGGHQPYNIWGAPGDVGDRGGTWSGRCVYGDGAQPTNDLADRSYAVDFRRPYSTQATNANTYIFDSEYPWIVFAEAQGYPLTYLSDVDLHYSPTILETADLAVMLGHHEYLTEPIYDAWRNAQAAGVNTFIDSSNTALWRVRFDPSDTVGDTMICYKDSSTADVAPGWTGTGYDPVEYTGTWRDTRNIPGGVDNPGPRRENELTGQMFVLSAAVVLRFEVPDTVKALPIWRNSTAVQALTEGTSWQAPIHTVGDEADIPDGSTGQPANLINLCPTPIAGGNGANDAGTIYTTPVDTTGGMTLHRHDTGALVLNTGSWRAWNGTSRWGESSLGDVYTASDADWQNALLAILYDLGLTPVTPREMRPGLDDPVTDPATGAPTGTRDQIAKAYGLMVPARGMLLFYPA